MASFHDFSSRKLYTIPESSETNTINTNTTVQTNTSSTISKTITSIEEPLEMRISQIINENISATRTNEDGKGIADSNYLSRKASPEQIYQDIESSSRNDQDSLSIRSAPRPVSSKAMILVEDEEEEDEDANNQAFTPIYDWLSSNLSWEPQLDTTLKGDETACKIKFCEMLIAAYQQYQQRGNDHPQKMRILFNEKDDIKGISVIQQNGSREDYLEFGG